MQKCFNVCDLFLVCLGQSLAWICVISDVFWIWKFVGNSWYEIAEVTKLFKSSSFQKHSKQKLLHFFFLFSAAFPFPWLLVKFCTSVSCLILCWRESMEGWTLSLHICMFGSWLNTLLKSKQASCRNHFCMNFRSLAWYISMFSGHLDCDHYVAGYLA